MVNCSTGARSVSTRMGMRAKSRAGWYCVPHCPVWRLTISVHPSGLGMLYSVYVPRGTRVVPRSTSTSVTKVVAAFAPVRQTRPYGTSPPMMRRPRMDGRP